MTRVLIVDDEPQLRRALGINFRERGYEVDLAESGEFALSTLAHHRPDAMVLDLGLPDMDGIDVIKAVREFSDIPIVILSVREGEATKVAALDAGADDYITKPFGIDELLARLRAVLRRNNATDDSLIVETPDFIVDMVQHQVFKTDSHEVVKLTPTEWNLIDVFVHNIGKLMTHKQLLQSVWGANYGDEANYLRVYMAQLRRKLEPNPAQPRYLLTETGMGYRFRAD